ncbi:hypothetical protein GGS20DRAFT_38667 [Poronia punctata]|nr:hypothetical protein GGS20DRAFT_38667 [Poronia punctata]
MRLFWYAGASTALATGVIAYAFNQRANFYSAMVYLSQNNLSLMILVNLVLLVYATLVWGLQRLCYGPLRPVEIEQLYEKAWFAVTETCLAMTIFREEVGGWFLVMFTALVTGKVWEWIGEGRVEVLEQQPPANPRLFHSRLSISLILSVSYDIWLFTYAVRTVIQQARPNMMVMFLFEFAILTTCSFRTAFRYLLSLVETNIVKKQTETRLEERRRLAREQRNDILRRRESDDAAEAEAAQQEELPDENDIDEMDIEVPGWESKGHWILTLDLVADFVKLCIYGTFFAVLLTFYGLPIHIIRDLYMTARSFVKRLGALLRYRKALQDMSRYPDATEEDLGREDTCIICREEMRPWDPTAHDAVERSRPKKLPCGHILHFGCLKGWLERQQVCPTCRRSVVIDAQAPNGAAGPGALGGNAGVQAQGPVPIVPNGEAGDGVGGRRNGQQPAPPRPNFRVFRFGPVQFGFGQGDAQELAGRLRIPMDAANQPHAPPTMPVPAPSGPAMNSVDALGTIESMQAQLADISDRIQREMHSLQTTQAELQTLYALTTELNRLRQIQIPASNDVGAQVSQVGQGGLNTGHVAQHPPSPFSALHTHQPAVTRYGGAQYASTIPSGSPDLPEGVRIPPGWSVLPLQRLHDPQSTQPTPTVEPLGVHQPQSTLTEAIQNRNNMARVPTSATGPPSVPPNVQFSARPGDTQNGLGRANAETSSSSAQGEPSHVAAPIPVAPQWASSQLPFGYRDESSATPAASDDNQRNEDQSGAESHAATDNVHSSDNDALGRANGKGKAKAVSVEDAEDDESD